MRGTTEYQTVNKGCEVCGTALILKQNSHIIRKRFCSVTCRVEAHKGHGHGANLFREARKCQRCGIDFIARQKTAKSCSSKCARTMAMRRHVAKHNTLKYHVKRLVQMSGYDRSKLSVDFLLDLYTKQEGRCALTGLQMTWEVGSGHVPTNLSIDRISSFCGYTQENVQLVCRVANIMKGRMSQDEFVGMCKRVLVKADAL